jgi:hypothetical protein
MVKPHRSRATRRPEADPTSRGAPRPPDDGGRRDVNGGGGGDGGDGGRERPPEPPACCLTHLGDDGTRDLRRGAKLALRSEQHRRAAYRLATDGEPDGRRVGYLPDACEADAARIGARSARVARVVRPSPGLPATEVCVVLSPDR